MRWALCSGSHCHERTVQCVPGDAKDGGEVPAPKEKAHLRRGISTIFPEKKSVGDEKERAEREKDCDHRIGEVVANEE